MKGRHWIRRPSGLWTPGGIYVPTRFLTGTFNRKLGMLRSKSGVSDMAGGGVGEGGGSPPSSGVFTHVANDGAESGDVPMTVSCPGTITAGNLLIAWAKWEGSTVGGCSAIEADGGTFTAGTLATHGSGDLHGQFLYLLVADGGGTGVVITFPASATWASAIVMEFSYTGTASLDVQNIGSGSGTGPVSGTVTTTTTTDVCLGGYSEYSATNTSSELIGGTAAGGNKEVGAQAAEMWYQIRTTTLSNGTSSLTLDGAGGDWICNIISFKSAL